MKRDKELQDDGGGLVAALQALLGGAVTSLASALAGRLMYHSGEVSRGRRRFLSVELLLDLPIVLVAAVVAEAIGSHLHLSDSTTIGLASVLAYLGPRGAHQVAWRILTWWKGGPKDGS